MIFSSRVCYGDIGTIKGQVNYPEGSPQGVILFFFSDPQMDYLVEGLVIQSQEGYFEIKLPQGVYYIQAQIDVNKNGQTDPGDLIFTYGGEKPVPVSLGSNIIFSLGDKNENSSNLAELPSDKGNNSSSNIKPFDTEKGGSLRGKVLIPGHSPVGVVLVVFKDPSFETMLTASKITSSDGSFNIVLPEGKYYIQAFYDINGNGQIDRGDIAVAYGGDNPEGVKGGDEILITFDNDRLPQPATTVAIQTVTPTPTPVQGNLRVRIVYPDHSPVGTLIRIASDPQFKIIVAESSVQLETGMAGFSLQDGKYYIQAFYDNNSNKKIDSGEYYAIYKKGKPRQVGQDEGEVILILEEMRQNDIIPDIPDLQLTPTPSVTSSLPPDIRIPEMKLTPGNTSAVVLPDDIGIKNSTTPVNTNSHTTVNKISKSSILRGKVSYRGDPTGIVIFIFSDINFKQFVTSTKVKDDRGEFLVELPDGNYYLQAFVDINKNQILDIDDILVTYTGSDGYALKAVSPGEEEILIKIETKNKPSSNSNITEPPQVISSSRKEYTITGKVIWKDHSLSKGVIEAYSDTTFQNIKARAKLDRSGGEFSLKVPEGKYFLTVVIDDNMDNVIGLSDGVGIYGMESIAGSRGEPRPVIVDGDDISMIEIPVTDFVNMSGQLVSLDKYEIKDQVNSGVNPEFKAYSDKISNYKEIGKNFKISGKIYFSGEGDICVYDFSSCSYKTLFHGVNPTVSSSGDKISYIGAGGEIILSSTDGTNKEIISPPSNIPYKNLSLSSKGDFLVYEVGREVILLELANKKEYKKIFTNDTTSAPFQVGWFSGDEKIVYLRGAGRKDITESVQSTNSEKPKVASALPFDGIKMEQQTSINNGNNKQSVSDGIFPILISRTVENENKGAGVYIWNKDEQESYFMDFKEIGSIGNTVWSPRNPTLFLFTTGLPSQIWLGKMTDKGLEKAQLTVYGGHSPSWSPDEKNIVYVNNRQIWLFNVDSKEEIPLLNGVLPIYGENPCWSY